jgi:hypothetical protein
MGCPKPGQSAFGTVQSSGHTGQQHAAVQTRLEHGSIDVALTLTKHWHESPATQSESCVQLPPPCVCPVTVAHDEISRASAHEPADDRAATCIPRSFTAPAYPTLARGAARGAARGGAGQLCHRPSAGARARGGPAVKRSEEAARGARYHLLQWQFPAQSQGVRPCSLHGVIPPRFSSPISNSHAHWVASGRLGVSRRCIPGGGSDRRAGRMRRQRRRNPRCRAVHCDVERWDLRWRLRCRGRKRWVSLRLSSRLVLSSSRESKRMGTHALRASHLPQFRRA